MMKKMRKTRFTAFFLAVLVMLIVVMPAANSFAYQVGDEIGDVLNTDIRTYINGYRIPSYNINNMSVVLMSDLINYGFDSHWDPINRVATLIHNPTKPFTPLTQFDEQQGRPGTVAFRHLYTDITAVIDGKTVQSFNVRGNTAILFGDLSPFGKHSWNGQTRESSFTHNTYATDITLSRSTATLNVGEALNLSVTISPVNAIDKTVIWRSNNAAVANVDSYGRVVGIAPGTATITAIGANGISARCVVTVKEAVTLVRSVTLDRTSETIRGGDYITLTATILPTDATDKTVNWKSSNTRVAYVDNYGRVTAVAAGTATITATSSNGITAVCIVTVVVPANNIYINEPDAIIGIGEVKWFTASVSPTNAADAGVTWTSSHPHIATVDRYSGRVTGVMAPGAATITAQTANGLTATRTVTVTQAANVPVTNITLNQTEATVTAGKTVQLVATVWPANATNRNVTWTSGNPSVATVSPNGLVTALTIGTTVITAASADGTVIAICVIKVEPMPLIPLEARY